MVPDIFIDMMYVYHQNGVDLPMSQFTENHLNHLSLTYTLIKLELFCEAVKVDIRTLACVNITLEDIVDPQAAPLTFQKKSKITLIKP